MGEMKGPGDICEIIYYIEALVESELLYRAEVCGGANNCDCTGAHVSSDCENLFGSWQTTPKSVTAVQIGMGG